MRTYRSATIITSLLTLVSIIGAAYFNFFTSLNSFWCNLSLGIFGSGLVTFITSVIGYRVERRKTFEGFSYTTKQILKRLNKYQSAWPLEQKIDFFLDFHDIDMGEWDRYYGDFCFMFDFTSKNRTYIFEKIYRPIQEIDQKINYHIWHFRWHKDGSGHNERAMEKFVQEIENLIIETTSTQFDDFGGSPDSAESFPITQAHNKVVKNVIQELNGEYYRLMYGNKIYQGSKKSTV